MEVVSVLVDILSLSVIRKIEHFESYGNSLFRINSFPLLSEKEWVSIKIMSNMFEGLDFWFEQIIAYCIALVLVQFMKKQI